MTDSTPAHFLQIFFADMRKQGDWPLLYDKQGLAFHNTSKREAALQINRFARALHACAIAPGDRVAFCAGASSNLWVGEWGTLASRAVAVIVPRDFDSQELLDTLAETHSKLAIVDELSTAQMIVNSAAMLPDLTHIICMEGSIQQTHIPIKSWNDFRDSSITQADRSAALLRSIAPKDTAILFYWKDEEGKRQASRYTHARLLEHARKIDAMLALEIATEGSAIPIRYRIEEDAHHGRSYAHPEILESMAKEHAQPSNAAYIRNVDTVLSAIPWEHIASHIMACYVPVLKEAAMQLTPAVPDISMFGNRPHVIVGSAAYFDHIRQHVMEHIREQGQMDFRMLTKVLALSKIKYEKTERLSLLQKLQDAALQVMIVKKVLKLLGSRLRLLIGVDNAVRYETQLFFFAFGIDLVELPPDNLGE